MKYYFLNMMCKKFIINELVWWEFRNKFEINLPLVSDYGILNGDTAGESKLF